MTCATDDWELIRSGTLTPPALGVKCCSLKINGANRNVNWQELCYQQLRFQESHGSWCTSGFPVLGAWAEGVLDLSLIPLWIAFQTFALGRTISLLFPRIFR